MCKVLIKEIKKAHEVKTGTSDSGNKWSLWLFDCVVDVDNTGKFAERTVKTFDKKVAETLKAGEGKTFEAKKQGESSPFSYMVNPVKNTGFGQAQGFARTNRQTALELAYKLAPALAQEMSATGDADSVLLRQQVFELAEDNLAWLEEGSK